MNLKSFTFLALVGILLAACEPPAKKDPPFDYKHNRQDAKVEALSIDATNPLMLMGVENLWKRTTGKTADQQRVKIGVVGTGIDYTIPDLRDSLWMNLGEWGDAQRFNGVDDDANGYVDDLFGYDFAGGDNMPYDWHGHDTYTASLIAATARTNPQMVGVAPNAELIVARYLSREGRGNGMDASLALAYVVQNGAKVVYFNWPEGGFRSGEIPLVEDVIIRSRQTLFVIPAGNSRNLNVPSFVSKLGAYSNVILVAGLSKPNQLTRETNFGASMITIAAPAVGSRGYLPGGRIDDSLETTSVAAAYATGVAALLSTLPDVGTVPRLKQLMVKSVLRNEENESLDVLSGGLLNVGQNLFR